MRPSILERWSEQVQRLRNRRFLDASMAAAALVSAADRDVRLSEQMTLDQLLERMDRLRVFDPHAGVNLHRSYTERILADPESGRKKALASIASFAGDAERGLLVLYVGAAVAKADGELSDAEIEALAQISAALELPDPQSLDRIWGQGESRLRSPMAADRE